ncbi:MAG: TetR family transcriptional regulator [Bdellovibrionota bacterium]
MSEDKKVPAAKAGDSKELLLEAAKRVFAAKGYEGATVKDLADEAGVNVSLVSYHFGGKENLYKSCLEGFGLARVETAKRILKTPNSPEEFKLRLRLFGEDFIEIHRKEPHTCKIVQTAIDMLNAVTMDIFKNVFFNMFATLRDFVKAAQTQGFLKQHLDPEITAAMMFGGLMHILRSQDLAKQLGMKLLADDAHAATVIDHWIEIYTEGIFERTSKEASNV